MINLGFPTGVCMCVCVCACAQASHWEIDILCFRGRASVRVCSQSSWWKHLLSSGNLFSSFAEVLKIFYPEDRVGRGGEDGNLDWGVYVV